jgi:hypothetical protein
MSDKTDIELVDNVNYEAIEAAIKIAIVKSLSEFAEDVVAAAQYYLKAADRVDTANLIGSIKYKIEQKDNTFVLYIFTNVEYGIYVEFGTGIYAENGMGRKPGWVYKDPEGKFHYTEGMKATPFLRPGFDTSIVNFFQYLFEYINKWGKG